MNRTVVLLCGPPGAGKTTAAKQSGFDLFDRDDEQWHSEKQFTAAIAKLASDPLARAVVIRSGASSRARRRSAALIGATHVYLMTNDEHELVQRIRRRNRGDAVNTIAGMRKWFASFDRTDGVSAFPGWPGIGTPDLGVMSEDW